MCDQQLYTQCETTQVRDQGMGAALFGFSKLYGEVAGGQAEYLRVPQAQFTHIKLPEGPPDDRFAYLSDILPTAWQGVEYANVPDGGTLVVLGLGPIGDFACRIAQHKGYRVIGVDLVPERLERVRARGVEVVDLNEHEEDLGDAIRDMTGGRGPDSVLDAVGMEAHGSPATTFVQKPAGLLPRGGRRAAHGEGRRRPAQRAVLGDRHRPPRRHDLADRRLRRCGRPDPDDDDLRQADPAALGPVQHQALDPRHHAAAHRRRSAGLRHVRHPPGAAVARRRRCTASSRRRKTAS